MRRVAASMGFLSQSIRYQSLKPSSNMETSKSSVNPKIPSAPARISSWEYYFNPQRSTSQEKWFLNTCVLPNYGKHVIVTTFRGCGASTTLRRVQARWWCGGGWRLLTRRVEVCDAATIDQVLNGPTPWQLLLKLRRKHVAKDVVVSLIIATVFFGFYFWLVGWASPDDHSLSFITSQWPASVGITSFVAFFLISLTLIRMRRLVLVLDDVVSTSVALKYETPTVITMKDPKLALYLRYLSDKTNANVIFVTSNEGLGHHFEDTAPSTRVERQMPALTAAEMEERLVRMNVTPNVKVEEVVRLYGEELGLSARFYLDWNTQKVEGTIAKPTRADLLMLCENLTLSTERISAIVCSHLVDIHDYEHFPIEGCVADTEKRSAVDYIKLAFPDTTKVPHRLVIPMILAATSHVAPKGVAAKEEAAVMKRLSDQLSGQTKWDQHCPSQFDEYLSLIKSIQAHCETYCQLALSGAEIASLRSELELDEGRKEVFNAILTEYTSDTKESEEQCFHQFREEIWKRFEQSIMKRENTAFPLKRLRVIFENVTGQKL